MAREVQFHVICSGTRPGWHVRIVGGCQALGKWDPKRGVPFRTTAVDFPLWKAESAVRIEDAGAVEYKYVICDDAVARVQWESTPNRNLQFCPLFGIVTMTEVFDTPQLSTSVAIQRSPSGGRSPECAHPPSINPRDSADMFQPTMRERCPSMSRLGSSPMPGRSASMSLLAAPAPEVVNASFEDVAVGKEPDELVGLVREESCSNLLLFAVDEPAAEEPRVSKAFDLKYGLIGGGPIGEGNFGLVWRCRPMQGGTERAAKVVRKARLQARESELLLGEDGEICTHMTLKHPHIVELHEYFDEDQTVTLLLEYCPGGDLFDAIIRHSQANGRGLDEHQAVVAARHTLSALAYLHGLSIVHRDIKCENVLLAHVGVPLERNVFKVCDFGFAAHDRGEGLRDRLGSPDTVAPEVVVGLHYSFPADLWSAGVLVFMMLSASPPFKAATDAEVLRKVRAGRYSLSGPPWDGVSAPPKHVITSLMILEAKLRPTAAETLGKAWFQEEAPSAA